MKIERIQYSLEAATKEITRYAATQRVNAVADLLKEKGRSHYQTPNEDEDEEAEREEPADPSIARMRASARLLDITA
jgi:hypothetical protein